MKTPVELFTEDLAIVLDEYFPKVEVAGPEKKAMKRGPALVLFGDAVLGARKTVQAFGGCTKCYGKGYGTETLFAGSNRYLEKLPTMKLCNCPRGTQLGDLIESDL